MSTKLTNPVLHIDALLREAAAVIWASLPPEKRDAEQLQSEALRLVMRVIENFCDDLAVFTPAPQSALLERPPVRGRFANTGKPWSAQADEELRALFESGNAVADLALYFERSANGIRARLVKLGLLDANAFRSRFAA